MTHSGDLAKRLVKLLDKPAPTVDLYGRYCRDGELVSKSGRGPRSAAHMTSIDATNWLFSLAIEHERGGDFLRETKRALGTRLLSATYFGSSAKGMSLEDNAKSAFQFLGGLKVAVPANLTAGAAIAALIDDMRSGAFDRWAEGVIVEVTADFHASDGRILLMFSRPQFGVSAVLMFARASKKKPVTTEKIYRVHQPVFQGLADVLGATPSA